MLSYQEFYNIGLIYQKMNIKKICEIVLNLETGQKKVFSLKRDGVELYSTLNNVKSYTYLTKKISYNHVPFRGMRKAAQNAVLSNPQKHEISSYLYEFINCVINNTKNKDDLLPNLNTYFSNNSLGEFILKQSIAKGFFPTFTFRKKDVLPLVNTSKKLVIANPQEKTDVRFFPEAIIANTFAEQQITVKQISFNSENPSEILTKIISGGGNYVHDLTMTLSPYMNIQLDVKTGNNAYQMAKGILAPAPVLPDGTMYRVLCDKVEIFDRINEYRLEGLGVLAKKNDSYSLPYDVYALLIT